MNNSTDNTLPVRKHLPHVPPMRVSQYAKGSLYFITICADRNHYGIAEHSGGLGTNRPTNSPTLVGRVIPNAPSDTQTPPLVGRVIPNAPHPSPVGGIGICRPANIPLIYANNAVRLLLSLEFYRAKGIMFPRFALIMPDHMHMLAAFPDSTEMAQTIQNWKRWTAKEIGIVWQDGFFDYRPRNDAEVAEKMDYIAKNPVRKGLCETAEEWPFRMAWR